MRFYRRLSPIKAMTFDLDDTLYDNRPTIRRVESEITQWLHHQYPISATKPYSWWQQVKLDVAKVDPMVKHDVTRWRFEQVKHGLALLGLDQEQATLAAKATIEKVLVLRSQFDVPSETHRVLKQLSERYPLVAITNGNVDVSKIGLDVYFSLTLKAGPDGRAKPSPDLFSKASDFLNIAPKYTLHVGDHLITDVAGAKRNGFQACWYNDQGSNLMQHPRSRTLPDVEISQLDSLLSL